MSKALAVYHGRFGRATLYLLNRPMATHAHREGHLTFHARGACSGVQTDGEWCPLTPHLASAVNPWQPHSFHPGDPEHGTMFLVLYIKPVWFLEMERSAQHALRFGRKVIEVTDQISRLVRRISTYLRQEVETDLFDGYLFELTQECFNQSWQWIDPHSPVANAVPHARDFRIRNSIRLMKACLGGGDSMVLHSIAREAGLSRAHFFKLFRENTGLTPNIYLNTLRMENAIELLTTTEEPVTSIGLDLGFASQASFTRFFAANVGIPPSDYRRVAHLVSAHAA